MEDSVRNVRESFYQSLSTIASVYPGPESKSITELVFRNLLNCSRFDLYHQFYTNLPNSAQIRLDEIIIDLKKFKPLQYILGETEFYGLTLKVGPGALIPRPETEELVEWIINDSKNFPDSRILDIGTGSACIALALKKNLPSAEIDALDVSDEALHFARINAELNKCEIHFFKRDILDPGFVETGIYDIIVSNPPYIPEAEKLSIHKNVLDFEPSLALFVPDNTPLLFYTHILDFALATGKSSGRVYFEIHENFATQIQNLFESRGFGNITIKKDIHGKDRMASGMIPFRTG